MSTAGHYFWDLSNNTFKRSDISYGSLPFDPNGISKDRRTKGDVDFHKIDGYSILRICGSCIDERLGTKSIFFVKEDILFVEMCERMLNIQLIEQMLKKMPFHVLWDDVIIHE